jgi:hypothetical protein
MTLRSATLYRVLLGAIVASMVACVSLQSGETHQPISPIQSTSTPVRGAESDKTRPDTKIVTVNLEGQATQMELRLFHQDMIPFTTYYPVGGFVPAVEQSETEQATTVQFQFSPTETKDDQAYITVFIPDRALSTQALQDLILGERGLLVTNQWELVDRTDIVSYPWATEKLIYQHYGDINGSEAERMVGSIYFGQEGGQTFYVITHYPIEYGDGFEPRSSIVLENLQFDDR